MEKFKIGDVVMLKSGSPKLTIYQIKNQNTISESICCTWFDINQIQVYGDFPNETLELFRNENS